MPYDFLDTFSTPGVTAAQTANGSAAYWSGFRGNRSFDRFTEVEKSFIAARDTYYIATVAENGWPYAQHRGGPPGFLRVLDDKTLGVADFRGNRQYISVGNLAADDRAALILVDYTAQQRLKILAHVEVKDWKSDPELAERLATPDYKARVERGLIFHLKAFDWNCSQHITPRFTEAELAVMLAPVRERMAELEAENKSLREKLGHVPTTCSQK
jgi:predicted pyridoxine 5'-phosphate oxidase superfamily flavin-nucleotide-binding protein